MRSLRLIPLLLALSTPALAGEIYFGTLVASGGASANNLSTSNIKTDGTTGALTIPVSSTGQPSSPVKMAMQCDVPVRVKFGHGTVTASNTRGANYGPKIDVEQLFAFNTLLNGIAIIPASGSGAANCDLYLRTE